VSQPIEMRTGELVAGVRSDVGIVLYGPDLDELVHYGDAIARQVQDIEGIVDVRAEQTAGLRYLRIIPDRHRLARHGLTIADVNLAAETMSVGHEVGFVLEGDRKFAIRVRVDHPPGGDLQALAATPLHSSLGHMIPLEDVAELKLADGPAAIDREALSRRRIIEFNVRGRDLGSAVAEAQRVLEREGPSLPPGYRVEWGGSFVHYEQARDRLFVVIPAALGGILFLLWLAFRRVRPALLVFIAVPFGTIGGIVALWLRDIPFSISAGVGFIALFGVTVLNALVLVSTSRTFERTDGSPPAEAIGQAARLRLRPVLMTALTDIGGFVPMALSTAPGSEVQRPLATAVIGGLMTASLLTLVLLPAIYAKFGGGRRGAGEPEEEE
jgi:cobalt-zinc-cadmium resistance protein CzcA